ncbi:MAG: DUF2164 domain-containing protein [Endomicrobium sp.]|nr:DUF2164 domain-containing protein [Endomicrobium sp.]
MKKHLQENFDVDIGNLKTILFLDFISKNTAI